MHATIELILEQVRGVWRFRWSAMLIAWGVCLIGWLVVLALSDTYSAWARVHIDTHSGVTENPGGDSDFGAKVGAVREALLEGPQLEKVAGLAIPAYATSSPAQQRRIVGSLRKRLQIDGNSSAGASGQRPDLYSITYTDPDRDTARRVVDQLLRLFLVKSLRDSQKQADEALQFLNKEIAEREEKLHAAEARLADFKQEHEGLLPGVTGDLSSRLQTAKEELEKLRLDLQVAEKKRDALKRELSEQAPALPSATPGGDVTDTEAQIRTLEAQIRELRKHFTDKHPDVIEALRTLEDLKAQRQAELQIQLNHAELDVAAATRKVESQQTKVDDLSNLIKTAPQVEAEYSRLNRDYDAARAQYQTLVEGRNRAELAAKAEATGAVTRFEVLQPATVSDAPVSPDRPRLILAVLLGGLAAGLGMAYFLHQLRPVFTSARELGAITMVPVLGIVGITGIERHMARERRAVWAFVGATAVLVLVAGIVLLIQSPTSQLLHGLMA